MAAPALFAEATDVPPPDRSFWHTFIMLGLAVVLFYFILFRPEQKRRKAAEQQRSQLKKGDRIIAMGIVGTVLRVQENTVIAKMYDGAKIEFLKAAISEVIPASEEEAKKIEGD